MNRLRISLAAALLLASLIGPSPQPVLADSGEAATPALQDQMRRISVGGLHTCALLDTGEVQCWGHNDHGQLGNDTLSTTTKPVTVKDLTSAVSISAGSTHTCALIYGGSVSCWGLNGSGQIGVDPVLALESTTPEIVPDLTDATAIAAGGFHNCAIVADGTVRCWGMNGNGELGDGTNGFSDVPVAVLGITAANPAVALALGDFHSCAILDDGTVTCWGHNGLGQLGDGTEITSATPVAVSGISDPNGARAITAGSEHTCAVLDDDSVRCWGLNFYGQLGNDDHGNTDEGGPNEFPKFSNVPVTPSGNPQAVAISAGAYHTCTLRSDGEARCWGNNGRGQLGYLNLLEGPTPVDQDVPREVQSFSGGTALTAGGFHTCALVGSAMKCWGYNFYGQLGGFRSNNPLPVAVTALTGATAISTGDGHACAIVTAAQDKAECWGSNSDGQLGVAGIADSTVPVIVSALGQTSSISAGNRHSCVLEQGSQQPKCFGFNANGQLGDGTTTSKSTPTAVSALTTATQVATGGAFASGAAADRGHSCARRADGTAVCWGRNFDGQLGDESNDDSSTPVVVKDLTGVVAVATGGFHSCAIVGGGAVKCWGNNDNGQLGNDDDPDPDPDDLVDSNVPVPVVGITGATSLSLGAFHSCARVGTGVKCWGDNSNGQLGDETGTDRPAPVDVENIPGVYGFFPIPAAATVTAGDFHTCARHTNGLVTCWGDNFYGQLGNGGVSDTNTPTPIAVLTPPPSPNISVLEVSAGRRNTCVRLIETTVHCWGDNTSGQLGDGIGPFSLTPISVVNLGSTVATNAIPNPVDDAITTAPVTPVSVDVLANDTDADVGDVLTVTNVTDPPQGTATLTPPGTIEYTPDVGVCAPANPDYGHDSFNYTVTDGTASVGASVTVTITCPNRPPVAEDDSATVAEDASVTIDVRANDSDPDGDPLTVVAVSDPAHGAAVIVAGSVEYTTDPDYCGPDSFTYTVSDGTDSDVATVTISVTCGDDPPVANDDAANTTEDVAVELDVLANDTDVDPGSVLTIVSVGHGAHGFTTHLGGGNVRYQPDLGFCGVDTFEYIVSDGGIVDTGHVTITVACEPDGPNAADDSATVLEDSFVLIDVLANDTDPDGDVLSILSVTNPPHGTAVIEAGKIRYTPDPDFCGADGFGYVVQDPSGLTDGAVVAPVNVICNQDPPTAVDDVGAGTEDTPFAIDVLANDFDVDGDVLTITSVTNPPKGTVAIGANGLITYTPNANTCGADAFDYTIDDNNGGTDTATVTVTIACVNDAPTLAGVGNQTTPWGAGLALTLVGSDVDLDPLTYSVVSGPAGLTVGPGAGVAWTPTSSQLGSHPVTVRVSDGTLHADRSFTVTVTKRATAIVTGGASTVQYSDQASVSATLTDSSPGAANGSPIGGVPVSLAISSQTTSATTNASGIASGTIVVNTAAGPTTSTATFAGSSIYLPASNAQPFVISKEAIVTVFTGTYITTTAGSSASIALSASVTEEPDGRLGSALHTVTVTFSAVGGGVLCSAPVTVTGAGTGTASCNASSQSIGSRAIMVDPAAVSYGGPVAVGAAVVSTSSSGAVVGAGTAAGESFAFEAKQTGKKGPVTGSAVHVWLDGAGHAFVAATTSVSSFSTSCSKGGNNKVCTVAVGANSGTVTDITLASGAAAVVAPASISVTATDASVNAPPDSYSVAVSGSVPHTLGTAASQIALQVGSIQVL